MVTYLRWLKLRSRCLTRQELPWLRWSGMDNGHLLVKVIEADGQADVWPDRSYPDSDGQGWTMVTYLRWLKLRSRCLTRQELPWLRWSGMDNGHLLEVIEAEVKMFDQTGVTLTQMVRDGQWSLTWGDWSWGQDVWPDRSYPDSDGQGWPDRRTMVTYLRWLKLRSRCLTRQELPWLRWSGMDNGHLLEVIEAEVKMFDQTGVTLTQMVRDGQWSLTWGDWSWGQDVWPDRSYPDSDGQGWTMVTYLRWLKLRSRCLTRQELPWLRWSGMDNGHLLEVIEAEVKMFDQTGVTLTQMVRDGQWSLTWGDWSWGQDVWPDRSYPDSDGQGWTMVTYLRWLKLRSRCLTRQELPWLRWSGMDNGHLLEVIEAEVKMFDQTGVTLTQMVRDGQWSLTWGDWSWGQDVWPDRSYPDSDGQGWTMVTYLRWLKLRSRCLTRQELPWLRWSGMDNGHLLEVIEAEVKMFEPDRSYPDSDGQGWTMVTYLRWLKLRSRCLTRQELPWLRWSGMDNGHLLEVIEAEVKMFDQTGVTLTQMVRDGQWSLTWGDWSWGQDVWPDRMFDQTGVTLTQMVRDGQWSLTWGDWSWGQDVWPDRSYPDSDGQGWTMVTYLRWLKLRSRCLTRQELPWLRWSGMDNGHLLEVIEAEVKMFDQTGVTLTQMVRDGQWSLTWGDWSWGQDVWPDRSYPDSDGQGWTMVTYLRWLKLKLRSRCLTRQELPWLRWSGMDNGHLLEVIEAEVKMFDQTGVTLTQMVRDGQWSLTWSWGQDVWPDRSYPDSDGQGWTMVTYLRWLKLRSRCLTRQELPWLRWSGMDNGYLLEVIEAEVKMFDQTGVTLTQMVRDGQWSLTWGDWSWGQDVWPDRSYPDSDGQGWTMVTYLRWLKLRSRCLTRQELPWLRWSGMDNGHLLEVIEAEVMVIDSWGQDVLS